MKFIKIDEFTSEMVKQRLSQKDWPKYLYPFYKIFLNESLDYIISPCLLINQLKKQSPKRQRSTLINERILYEGLLSAVYLPYWRSSSKYLPRLPFEAYDFKSLSQESSTTYNLRNCCIS